jgi:hypothetical protein
MLVVRVKFPALGSAERWGEKYLPLLTTSLRRIVIIVVGKKKNQQKK